MAQGIRKGSADAKQFLDKTLSPQYKGIENRQYQERAKVGGEFLQSLFNKEELHHFRKTELKQIEKDLKQREAQDRTRTIAAREHKAEAMLNAFKSSHSEGRFIKGALNALGHIQAVFKGINSADIQSIKNPLLQNLASLACGHGNKKDAAAAFASQVLQNPTYLFSDLRQAKLFLSRFLRQHGLGSLSRLLRRRGRRAHQRVMEKLQGYQGAFDRSVVSLSAKKHVQKVFSPPTAKKALEFVAQNKGIEAPKLPKPSREQELKESPEPLGPIVRNIPPVPPVPSSVKAPLSQEVARPPQAQGMREASSIPEAPPLPKAIHPEDISLDDLERMVADLGPIASSSNGPATNSPLGTQGNLSMDDLDAMMEELNQGTSIPSNRRPESQARVQPLEAARPQTVAKPMPTVPSPTDEELDRLIADLGGPSAGANLNMDDDELNRLLAELEQPNRQVAAPAQGQNVRVDTPIPDAPPLPGSIPPPPPPPGNMGSQGRPIRSQRIVAAEAIKTLDELVPVKPADNQGRSSTGKCEIAPQDMSKVQASVFKDLNIDKIQAFSSEQIASMTDDQQKAIPVEVISLVVARAIQAPRGLTPEQREARSVARKALACLDPKLVREALENSQEMSHKLYIQPKTVRGKQTDDLSMAYREIRRDLFKAPYKSEEVLSRLTLEQLAESKAKQQSTNGSNTQSLFDQIQAGKTLRKTGDKPSLDQASGDKTQTTEKKDPSVGDGGTFNSKLLDKVTQGQSQSSATSSKGPLQEVPESSDEDWDDEVEEEPDVYTSAGPSQNPTEVSVLKQPATPGGNNPSSVNSNMSSDVPEIEKAEIAIAEAAAQAVQVTFKMSDIQKHVDVSTSIRKAVEAMIQARIEEKMPELSETELNRLSEDIEGAAIKFYREKKSEYIGTVSRAAKVAAQAAAAEAIASGKSAEEVEIMAQQAAQVAAEKAVIEAVCKSVEDSNSAQISALIKQNSMGNRRKFIEDSDDEGDDDWD